MAGQGLACMRQIPAPWKRPRPSQSRCTVFLMDTLISFPNIMVGNNLHNYGRSGSGLHAPDPCALEKTKVISDQVNFIRCIALSHGFFNIFAMHDCGKQCWISHRLIDSNKNLPDFSAFTGKAYNLFQLHFIPISPETIPRVQTNANCLLFWIIVNPALFEDEQ